MIQSCLVSPMKKKFQFSNNDLVHNVADETLDSLCPVCKFYNVQAYSRLRGCSSRNHEDLIKDPLKPVEYHDSTTVPRGLRELPVIKPPGITVKRESPYEERPIEKQIATVTVFW